MLSPQEQRSVLLCGIAPSVPTSVGGDRQSTPEEKVFVAGSKIRSDLLARGFRVRDIPAGVEPKPTDFEGVELSVHLFARRLDSVSDPSHAHSLAALRGAITHSRTHPDFHIFVWAEPEPGQEGVLSAVDRLLRTEEWVGFSTEFVQTTVEDFKSLIYDRLSTSRSWNLPHARPASPQVPNMELYVIYDPQDASAAAPIAKFLEAQGIHVLLPNYAAVPAGGAPSATDMRAMHNENLRRCDAALIIYGNVHEPWVRMKLQDLLRSPALGRSRSLAARGVYLCAGMTETKRRFSAPGMMILQGSPATTPPDFASALGPFIQQLAVAK